MKTADVMRRLASYRGPHKCHAEGCERRIPPELLMCPPHWRKVPPEIQSRIRAYYREGQEVDKVASRAYIQWAKQAVDAVAIAEGRR